MESLDSIYKQAGFAKVFPASLINQIRYNGHLYSVPVNIHRANILWYNPKVFKDNNLEPPKTLDDFFKVADALKAKNITPLAVGGKDGFEASHLFAPNVTRLAVRRRRFGARPALAPWPPGVRHTVRVPHRSRHDITT